jgi:hypothetical protein
MGGEYGLDVQPDSSTGTGVEPASPAGRQPVDNAIPWSRVSQMIANERAQHAEERRQWQEQMAARSAPQPNRQGLTEEERRAGDVIHKIMREHDAFSNMRNVADAGPLFAQGYELTQQLRDQAHKQYVGSEHDRLVSMAVQSGMTQGMTPQQIHQYGIRLSHQVAGLINADARLAKAWVNGDRRVLDYVFNHIRGDWNGLSQRAQARVAATKRNVQGLPPRPVGGAPGNAAMPKITADNAGSFVQHMHNIARQRLSEG